jgi:4-hydroxy-3-methylbut-2-enyl diphosphate reductase
MKILIAKTAGFCFGVKRAINIAIDCNDESGNIYTLGPIIHNPQVVKKLEESSNVTSRENIDDMPSGTVILRSHGVKAQEIDKARDKGLNVVDATCPFVKKTQDYVKSLSDEGYTVIVVGEKEHPEVQGIVSYGKSDIIVAVNVDDLKGLVRNKRIGIVAQTTQSQKNLQAIVAYCVVRALEIKVINTICNATSVRQSESIDIAKASDCVIVVGGKNSANTGRLVELSRAIQPNTHHIEVAEEIDPRWLDNTEKVGVTAGASTPDWIILEVIERLQKLGAETDVAPEKVAKTRDNQGEQKVVKN